MTKKLTNSEIWALTGCIMGSACISFPILNPSPVQAVMWSAASVATLLVALVTAKK